MSECVKIVLDEPDMSNESVFTREIGFPAIIVEKPGSGIIKSIKANETVYVRSMYQQGVTVQPPDGTLKRLDFDGDEDISWVPIDVNYLRSHTVNDNIIYGSFVTGSPKEITPTYLDEPDILEVVVENNL